MNCIKRLIGNTKVPRILITKLTVRCLSKCALGYHESGSWQKRDWTVLKEERLDSADADSYGFETYETELHETQTNTIAVKSNKQFEHRKTRYCCIRIELRDLLIFYKNSRFKKKIRVHIISRWPTQNAISNKSFFKIL